MKATVSTEELRNAIKAVHLIPKSGPPLSTDTCIIFANDSATLYSTDKHHVIKTTINALADEPFTIVVPRLTTAKFLHDTNGSTIITADAPPTNVTLAREGLGSLTLNTQTPDTFPPLLPSGGFTWHTIDAPWLCQMLRIALPACADEMNRPILAGIACRNGAIAAADGFRLVVIRSNRLTFGLGKRQAIIPRLTAIIALRLFCNQDTIDIGFETTPSPNPTTPGYVHIKSGDTTITSSLIEGTYPAYDQLIPASFNSKTTFSAPLMSQRLGMIDVPAVYSGIVRFDIHRTDLKEDICSLTSKAEDVSHYSLSLPVKIAYGEDSKIALNHRYVMDAIKHFSVCHIETSSPSSPAMFTGDLEEVTILVMPMFVQW